MLNRLGRVLHKTPSKVLVLRLESNKLPKIGKKVLDNKKRIVGVVKDVFGPVKKPYISIKPEIPNYEDLIGAELFEVRKKRLK